VESVIDVVRKNVEVGLKLLLVERTGELSQKRHVYIKDFLCAK